MSYIIKEKASNMIRNKYKSSYLAREVGITDTYMSLVLNGKIQCSKILAYALTKALNSEAEVSEYFDRI